MASKKTSSAATSSPKPYKRVNAWDELPASQEKALEERSARYIRFLTECKTERETLRRVESDAKKAGFKNLDEINSKTPLKPGTRIYWINKNRAMGLAVIGKRPVTEGMRMVAAHHDVPHLDLKALPLYEKHGLALLRTHHYGGIKKFQWAAIPLALHGFAATRDGKFFSFSIGEKPEEPVFTITDIAPHLSQKVQNDRKATEVFKGEELNILVGNRPKPEAAKAADAGKKDGKNEKNSAPAKSEDRVKAAVLAHLYTTWGLDEEDLAWAEIAAVPAFPARDVGFDGSLVGGFGHDDRACVAAAVEAIFDVKIPENTAAVLLFDKEEIGSAGAAGAQSMMVPDFLQRLVEAASGDSSYGTLRRSLSETLVLSGDTSAAIEPIFEAAFDTTNSGFIGSGVWICKFTGSGGKSGSSEADVEFIARIRKMLTDEKIPYQFGEMGKVDEGGGGTVAKFLAQLNMHVLDLALPVLSLHSPFEILAKVDYHYTIEAYRAFLEKKL
ncbi:MAG: aminopeptidase [Candidatus Ozemobacteraceae bacterium]